MRVKEENEKAGLKLNIKKTKIMVSNPITSWQIEGGNVDEVTDFIFFGSQITVDSYRSLEIRRPLLLGRNLWTNLDSILKSSILKSIKNHFVNKGLDSQIYGFSSCHV